MEGRQTLEDLQVFERIPDEAGTHRSLEFFVNSQSRSIPDAPASAAAAASLGFVPTTSGVNTGVPPTAGKLRDMRAMAKDAGLAVASGLSPESLGELAPYIPHALVTTGVSLDWHNFDRHRLQAFATAAAAFRQLHGVLSATSAMRTFCIFDGATYCHGQHSITLDP